MTGPTEGQTLYWITDQVQLETCLDRQDANHYAGGLLTGYRLGRHDLTILLTEPLARSLASLAIRVDRDGSDGTITLASMGLDGMGGF